MIFICFYNVQNDYIYRSKTKLHIVKFGASLRSGWGNSFLNRLLRLFLSYCLAVLLFLSKSGSSLDRQRNLPCIKFRKILNCQNGLSWPQ